MSQSMFGVSRIRFRAWTYASAAAAAWADGRLEREEVNRIKEHMLRFSLRPEELREVVAQHLGKPLRPSAVKFVKDLPKTRNAKVMRRVIRAAYLGEKAGDLSALENPRAVAEIEARRVTGHVDDRNRTGLKLVRQGIEMANDLWRELLHERQELEAHSHSQVASVRVRGILGEPDLVACKVRQNVRLSRTDQRADQRSAPRRKHAQPLRSRPPEQPQQNRLGSVVRVMRREQHVARLHHGGECRVARRTRRRLEARPHRGRPVGDHRARAGSRRRPDPSTEDGSAAGDARRLIAATPQRLADETVRRLAGGIRSRFAHAVEVVDPEEYNARWSRTRNLNDVLADAHVAAIRRLAEPGLLVLVDQFASPRLLEQRLASSGVELRQHPRAERVMAVAAASILALGATIEEGVSFC